MAVLPTMEAKPLFLNYVQGKKFKVGRQAKPHVSQEIS